MKRNKDLEDLGVAVHVGLTGVEWTKGEGLGIGLDFTQKHVRSTGE